ncbi:hypothetical protein KFK09_027514 [Dendrobium nobile]|uniref:Retrotransposon gag domain-containing protein n=1 Tax=Dendrobium nobile TaxID=94219 RepID=A0A8T3AAS5_DENNO|nr:hypothetical protein KFK09_027514 [Dendrobium nobile]
MQREEVPMNGPIHRRRAPNGRHVQNIQTNEQERTDSDDESQMYQGYDAVESSDDDSRCLPDYPRPHRAVHYRNHPEEFKVKLDIPFFDGRLHIEDYLDWERADYMEIDPGKQVKYVACRLKGGASAWWEQVLKMRQREGKGRVRNWTRMKQLLRSRFLPTYFEQILYMRYQH